MCMLVVCITSVQSEPDGFASFHLYVCAAFLTRFSRDLQRERDFHVSCEVHVFASYTCVEDSAIKYRRDHRTMQIMDIAYFVCWFK